MKKVILLLLILLCGAPALYAQGLSDDQVMSFILSESEIGSSRSEITKKLLQKGVTLDQLRRVRQRYEKQQKNQQPGARVQKNDMSATGQDRIRSSSTKNSDELDPTAGSNINKDKKQNLRENPYYKKRPNPRDTDFDTEIGSFGVPDSLSMYGYYEEFKEPDPTRQVFGRNIFNNKDLTFESNLNIPTPADYRLGAGDVVNIDVWGNTSQNLSSTVTPDGDIVIENYGVIPVGGLTVAQAQNRVKNTLGSRFQGSQVKVTVGQTKTITVNVMGEVNNPGTYVMSGFATVFNALYMAGGTNDIGTLRDIKVYRDGKLISSVDIYDFILGGNLKGNVRLSSNDVIVVGAYQCLVQVQGKVKRPMFYEMKSTESVKTLLEYAGGFTGDALEDNVRLVRKKGGMLSVFTLDEFERGTFQLADADSLYVDSTLQRYSNMVEIKGAVRRPGMYQMDGNVTTVRSLIERAGGFLEEAFPNHAVMHRRKSNRQLEVLSVDAFSIMGHEAADVTLRNEDVLYIPSMQDYNDELTLSIEGEVQYPGTYDFAENTTIEDLILQAGGLTDAASTVKVDVSRRLRSGNAITTSSTTAETFSFAIRDGFVINGERGFVLEPFDEVFVRRSPGYVEQGHIKVSGEVAFGGSFTITEKNMRLSEVLKMAGGITENGYAHGARLVRKKTEEEIEQQRAIVMSFMNNSLDVSKDSMAIKNKLNISDVMTVGIELDKAIEHPGDDRYDIVVKDGDELFVPGQLSTVSITGEVMYPNTVSYNREMRACDYIDQAGGYSLKAKKSRAYVLNPNGTVARLNHYSRIEPGATIIVPAKRLRDTMNAGQILSMTMSVASLGAVLINAIRN